MLHQKIIKNNRTTLIYNLTLFGNKFNLKEVVIYSISAQLEKSLNKFSTKVIFQKVTHQITYILKPKTLMTKP